MHELDKTFIADDPDLRYLRYCDDFIILHTDSVKCRTYVDRALEKLEELLLVVHSPYDYKVTDYKEKVRNKNGSRELNKFWNNSKSKQPYKWGPYSDDEKDNVPYVSFVGYQRRFDGLLRVRKKSLKKEYRKQKKLIADVVKRLEYGTNLNAKQIFFRSEQKLIAMAVGKMNLFNVHRKLGFCWCAGFKELSNGKMLKAQLKFLDRSRDMQLAKLKFETDKIPTTKRKGIIKGLDKVLFKPLTSYYHYFN